VGVRDRATRFLPVAALAGVVVGHWIAYLIAFPQAAGRSTELSRSGHGYWFAAIVVAVAGAALAASGTIVVHARRALGRPGDGPIDSVRTTAIRLCTMQTSLFLAQEVLERLRAGAPIGDLGHGSFLLIGLAVQIAVGAAIALVLTLVGRTAAMIARAVRARRRSPAPQPRIAELLAAPAHRIAPTPLGPRAPPFAVLA
jgi:hypothetical protein